MHFSLLPLEDLGWCSRGRDQGKCGGSPWWTSFYHIVLFLGQSWGWQGMWWERMGCMLKGGEVGWVWLCFALHLECSVCVWVSAAEALSSLATWAHCTLQGIAISNIVPVTAITIVALCNLDCTPYWCHLSHNPWFTPPTTAPRRSTAKFHQIYNFSNCLEPSIFLLLCLHHFSLSLLTITQKRWRVDHFCGL